MSNENPVEGQAAETTQMGRNGGEACSGGRNETVSRRAVLAAGGTATVGVLAGCLGQGSGEETDLTEVTYRHRFSRTLSSAINDAGVELGAWEEEGLDVTFDTSSGGQETAQAVANGQDDFTNPEIGVTLQLIEEGAPLKIVGNLINPLGGVISLPETGITDWTDLEGKEVGAFPWAVSGDLAMEAMRVKGGDPDKVELRNMNPGQHDSLLMTGEVDAIVAYYPQSVVRLDHQGYDANVLVTADVLDHLGNVLVTREEMVEENPDVVDSFVRGWLRAHELYISEPDEVVEIHKSKVSEFNEEVERDTLPALWASRLNTDYDLDYGMGWTPEEGMEQTLSVFDSIDFVEQTHDTDEYYTNQFIENNQDYAIEVAELYNQTLTEEYEISPDYV